MDLKRTLKEIKRNNKTFYFLALPNSKSFKFSIKCNMGSKCEERYQILTGKNIFGLSHLVEHLSFKSTKDFNTLELKELLKKTGVYNAGTSLDYIEYFHQTISEKYNISVRLVTNIALNDLSRVTEEEFNLERKVVSNEAKMYNSNNDKKFYRNATTILYGKNIEDDIIGVPETIDTFTLEDAKELKANFLNYDDYAYYVTYDPLELNQDTIIETILGITSEFNKPNVFVDIYSNYRNYTKKVTLKNVNVLDLKSDSSQVLNMLSMKYGVNIKVKELLNLIYLTSYLKKESPAKSLDYVIRESNGLTYNISYNVGYNNNPKEIVINFYSGVTAGDENKLIELLKETLKNNLVNFNFDEYKEYLAKEFIVVTISKMDQSYYNNWMYTTTSYYPLFKELEDVYNIDLDTVEKYILDNIIDLDLTKNILNNIVSNMEHNRYSLVRNKK